MFKAKTIMTTEVISVTPDTPINDAAKKLIEHKISGLPVIDADNNLVGILSEKDVLNLLIATDSSVKETVKDFMTKNVLTFSPEDSAVEICEFLMDKPFRRVPITENGKLIGLISRRDLIHLILQIRGVSSK